MARLWRQFPRRRVPPVPQASAPPYITYWKNPVNQPLRNRVPRRQQPVSVNHEQPPYPAAASQAPYLSYWVHPVNQPIRRTKRPQPIYNGMEPFYAIPVASSTPTVTSWLKRAAMPWRRVPRQQPPSVNHAQPPYPSLPSAPPYLSYWVHQVNQPLRNRVLKRQMPGPRTPPIPAAPSQAPYVSYWIHPVNQPLKRLRRTQPIKRPIINQPLAVNSWLPEAGQPLRRYVKRQQPQPKQNPFYAIVTTAVVPLVSSWIHPVNQPIRRFLKRLQTIYRQNPLTGNPAGTTETAPTGLTPSGQHWGMKLSQDGYDVKTAGYTNLIFSSAIGMVRVFATGTASVTIPAAAASATTTIYSPYYDSSNVPGSSSFWPAMIASTTINGKRYRSNMPYLFAGASSPNDYHSMSCVDTFLVGGGAKHDITIGRTASASTTGTVETFTVRYYIVGAL